jgi:hypothetical protein
MNNLVGAKVWDAQVINHSTTVFSKKWTIPSCSVFSVHLFWTDGGTNPSGTVSLQSSNVVTPNEATEDDWVAEVDESGTPIVLVGPAGAGGLGKSGQTFNRAGSLHYRLKYVSAAGDGTITARVNAKHGG